jgi:hypothetical protein
MCPGGCTKVSTMNANYASASNTIPDESQIQPQFKLRFERSASHRARGHCLVDVLLKNNGTIAASFPFFCLTNLGLNVSPANGWEKREITSVRKMQRFSTTEMDSSTLEPDAVAHCCTISLRYKFSFGGCLEFEPGSEYLLVNFPNLNLMCELGAGNFPSKRVLLQVPATALRKIIPEAEEQAGAAHLAQTSDGPHPTLQGRA